MRLLNIFFAILLISLLAFTMLIYLSPFTWGMRAKESYRFSEKFRQIESDIRKDSVFNRFDYEELSKWYAKDCDRGFIDEKKNLDIRLGEVDNKALNIDTIFLNKKIDFYAKKIMTNIPEKIYYDSLIFRYEYKKDSSFFISEDHFTFIRRAYKIK